jgi:ferrous iron transport protein A
MDSHTGLGRAAFETLAGLTRDQRAIVLGIEGEGPLASRLRDLGFLPGTEVRLLRRAPLGDPSLYELRGTRFCLRRGEAARVRVRSQPEGGA